MSDNWEDEDFEATGFDPVTKPASKWEGEDAEDEVKESWEDFDEDADKDKQTEAKASGETSKVGKVKKKKVLSEKIAEKEGKQRITPDEEDKPAPLTAEEIYEEKLARQRLQEDSDLELALDTFGVKNESKLGLETMTPTTKTDFDSFKAALTETITKHEKSPLYMTFLDELFRDLCLNLEAEDVKKLGNTIQILGNEKHKIKVAKSKKKGGKTKASLVVGRANDYVFDADYAPNEYEDFM